MDCLQDKMGPLSTKHDNESSSEPGTPLDRNNGEGTESVFYAIYIPDGPNKTDKSQAKVFHKKSDAFALIKSDKRARFKACSSLHEACQFSVEGGGVGGGVITSSQPVSALLTAEKSAFSGPKSVDLVRMRKAIEAGDLEYVRKTVWDNPRYLVSSGDTPSILQEGARYNALHVCARTGNAAIAAFVLQTVGSVEFVLRLFGEGGGEQGARERCRVLLDLYLNTPDKAGNETPLHFAAKLGAADVVAVLVAYPQCDKTMLNKFGQTPREIICSRANDKSEALSKRIHSLLDEQYYVPVLRSSDATIEPSIGQPFSPSSPLNLSGDIMSPVKEIHGLAGPMPLDVAKAFRKNWKTPPRDPQSPLRKLIQDPLKGLENIGRTLAQDCDVPWNEYWPFLGIFADFHSPEGLSILENYLAERISIADGISICNRSNREKSSISPISSSPNSFVLDNVININNNHNQNNHQHQSASSSELPSTACKSPSQNNNNCADSTILSPISELCCAMKSCRLSDRRHVTPPNTSPHKVNPSLLTSSHHVTTHAQMLVNGVKNESEPLVPLSVHLCIEKSLQVFAKRLTDSLLLCASSGAEMLACESAHMQTLVSSFLVDERFAAISFARLHGRIATCLTQRLHDAHEVQDMQTTVHSIRTKLLEERDSSSEEDEPSTNVITPYRNSVSRRLFTSAKKRKMNEHVLCLTAQILASLEAKSEGGPVLPPPSTEEACQEAWLNSVACQCSWPVPDSKRLSWRNRSFARKYCQGEDDSKTVSDSNTDLFKMSSDEDSDNSDDENEEFLTPPSTPGSQRLQLSDEDASMDSPDEGPDIYIYSDGPSYLDNAVYEALDRDKLDACKYPFICRWAHFISLHSIEERRRWGQRKRSPSGGHPFQYSPSMEQYSPSKSPMSNNFRSFRKFNSNLTSKRQIF